MISQDRLKLGDLLLRLVTLSSDFRDLGVDRGDTKNIARVAAVAAIETLTVRCQGDGLALSVDPDIFGKFDQRHA